MKQKNKEAHPLLGNQKYQIIFIILIVIISYSNIFDNEFIWDDKKFVLEWPEIRNFENVPELLKGNVPEGHDGVYRPLRSLFYTISYHFFEDHPLGYHVQSLIVHLICTILIYFISLQISKKNIIAFMTALLFGVHPIHTEAITFITTSFDIIGVIFFFSALLLYFKFNDVDLNNNSNNNNNNNSNDDNNNSIDIKKVDIIKEKNKEKKLDNIEENKKIILYLSSIFFALLAFFTYELTLTLLFVIILHDLIFKKINWKNWQLKIKHYVPYFLGLISYLFIRFFILRTTNRGIYPIDEFYFKTLILTITKGFYKYIELLVFPLNIGPNNFVMLDVSSWKIEISSEIAKGLNLLNFEIILSAIIILIIVILFFIFLKKDKLISFCIGLFFVTLLPVSNLMPFQNIIAERFLYVPSLAYCLLISYIFYSIYTKYTKNYGNKHYAKKIKILIGTLFIIYLLFFSIKTFDQNEYWQDSFKFWSRAVELSPKSSVAHTNLGQSYLNLENPEVAKVHFQIALQLDPNRTLAHYNLGYIYLEEIDLEKAFFHFNKTIELYPTYDEAYNNIGKIYTIQGDYKLAEEYFLTAIYYGNNAEAYYNLGSIEYFIGNFGQAKEYYLKAYEISSPEASFHNNLGYSLEKINELDLAIKSYERSIEIDNNYTIAYINLAYLYYTQNEDQKAIPLLKDVINIDPNLADKLRNTADHLLKENKTMDAKEHLIKAALLEEVQE